MRSRLWTNKHAPHHKVPDNGSPISLLPFLSKVIGNVQWSPLVTMGNYCREHAPDQLVSAVPVYRVSDRSNAQPVSN